MKDCNTQASGMSGDARKQFMSSCLSGGAAETKGPHCTKESRAAIPVSPWTKFAISKSATKAIGSNTPDCLIDR
jgi:hypothetical protein